VGVGSVTIVGQKLPPPPFTVGETVNLVGDDHAWKYYVESCTWNSGGYSVCVRVIATPVGKECWIDHIVWASDFEVVAKVLAYEGPYECIHVEIVSDVYSTLVGFRYYEDPNWWEKV
jgi:hypothetical protein